MEFEIISSAQVIPCLEAYFGPFRGYLRNPDIAPGLWERDSQRKRVYQAELVFEQEWGSGEKFSCIKGCQEYANKVVASSYWQKRFPYIKSIRVKHKRGKTALATFSMGLIQLPIHFYNELTLLHELAHHVVPRPHAPHGPLWCAVYADLVKEFLGEKASDQLAASFAKGRVKYGPLV